MLGLYNILSCPIGTALSFTSGYIPEVLKITDRLQTKCTYDSGLPWAITLLLTYSMHKYIDFPKSTISCIQV